MCERVISRRSQHQELSSKHPSALLRLRPHRGHKPSRRAERGPVRNPGAMRAEMVAAGMFRPDLDGPSPRGQIPPSRVPDAEPATRTSPHYLRLVVISGIRHGYSAPEPGGRERKKYSAPVWQGRKSRPAQVLPETLPGRPRT